MLRYPKSRLGSSVASDEVTHQLVLYLESLLDDLIVQPVMVLDPMLAIGESMPHTTGLLLRRQATEIIVFFVVDPPAGLTEVEKTFPKHNYSQCRR